MATITFPTYESWYWALDAYAWAKYGLSIDDLEDYCWRDLFDDGLNPAQALSCWRQDRD